MKERLKSVIKASPLWAMAKYALPRYHRPVLWAALARARAALLPGRASDRALARAYSLRAKAKLYENALEQAAAFAERALEIDPLIPDAADLHVLLGSQAMSAFEKPGSIERAAAHFHAALAREPRRLDYYYHLLLTHRFSGEWERMAEVWSRGLALQKDLARERGLDGKGVRFLGDSWLASIGHVGAIDIYAKLGALGLRGESRAAISLRPGFKVHNRIQLDLWRPFFDFVDDPAALGLSREDAALLSDELYAIELPGADVRWWVPAGLAVQRRWEEEGRAPLLKLPEDLAARGRAELVKMGVPEGAWFVALHVREPGYWGALDRTHPTARDSAVCSYLSAIRRITDRGAWVIRMGDASMTPLPDAPRVIDYARGPHKSDWMDVFLWASCRFFVGTCSGAANVPPTFGVPCLLTNWPMLGAPLWYGDALYLMKTFKSASGKPLGVGEVFAAGLAMQDYIGHFIEKGVSVVENTAQEIDEAVAEMLDRVEGRASYSTEDDARQRRFEAAVAEHGGHSAGRIGREFLKRHERLLAPEREALR